MRHGAARLFNDVQNEGSETPPPSFLSTSKANVSFKRRNKNNKSNNQSPSNLSPVDRLLLTLTSDQTSLLLGSIGILLLLLNRWVSFPDDPMYEAGRSRVDLLGVFAAGSVLLNGITKLDIESAKADRVILEGVFGEGEVLWNTDLEQYKQINVSTVEWVLSSFLKCSPARTAVLLTVNTQDNEPRWIPLAMTGVLPIDPELRTLIPKEKKTPILDRMLREDSRHAKGGTVGGTETASAIERRGPKESYLPTLQALPGKVEFTYLPPNAQEALLLPVRRSGDSGDTDQSHDGGGRHYALVLGGDTAKSFAPRDIVWCKEISSWIGCQ